MDLAHRAHDLPCPPREKILSIVGLSLNEAFAQLGGGAASPKLVESYKDAFLSLRQSGNDMEPLFPGAREALEMLARRDDILLGIATGKSRRGVNALFDHYNLWDHFHTIQTADDAPSKPHPGMVQAAMQAANVGPQDTAMIGDTVYDIAMARAAGARAVGVSWGYHAAGDLRNEGADIVIDEYAALVPTLDELWTREKIPASD